MGSLVTSLRLVVATMVVCVVLYAGIVYGVGQALTPDTANGSLVQREDGGVVGSRLVAQKFTQPRYLWPRPSAVDYNAAGAGGSNKSPTSPDLTARAKDAVAAYGATDARRLPADLAAASGGGLDPHVTERAALYQVDRVTAARPRLSRARIEALVREHAFSPGGPLNRERLVNVLEVNLALDREDPPPTAAR
jgi:K+-transporting ATPase ATPase C chain